MEILNTQATAFALTILAEGTSPAYRTGAVGSILLLHTSAVVETVHLLTGHFTLTVSACVLLRQEEGAW